MRSSADFFNNDPVHDLPMAQWILGNLEELTDKTLSWSEQQHQIEVYQLMAWMAINQHEHTVKLDEDPRQKYHNLDAPWDLT